MADDDRKGIRQWSPVWVVSIAVVVTVVGLGVAVILRDHRPATRDTGATSVAVSAHAAGGRSGQPVTPSYRAARLREEAIRARAARAEGGTYIPAPVPKAAATLPLALSAPRPKRIPSAVRSALAEPEPPLTMAGNAPGQGLAAYGAGGAPAQSSLAKRDQRGLAWLMTAAAIVPAATTVTVRHVHRAPAPSASGPSRRAGSAHRAKGARTLPSGLPADLMSVLRPGAMLYAENDLRLDSDSPGPVRATILAGPLKNAIALGSMAKKGNWLMLTFTSITTRAGTTYQISGYGVDPSIPAADVRSAVNRHLLSRWGGLLAASFLSGYGQAIAQSGSSVVSSGLGTVTAMPTLSPLQELEVAAGTVGTQLSSIAQQNFNRPNTVTLDPGVPLAILIIKR